MKKWNIVLIGILLMGLLLNSCASPEKLLSEHKYEKLWMRGSKKALKKSEIKVEWLNGMEIAYRQMQLKDSMRVVSLYKRNNKAAWQDILDIAERVEERQQRLQSIVPVYDKEGNRGNFRFMDVSPWKKYAHHNLTADFMQDALALLEEAEKDGNKKAAKKAVIALEEAKRYNRNIPDWKNYYEKAERLATVRLGIYLQESRGYFPDEKIFERKLQDALYSKNIPYLDIRFDARDEARNDYNLYLETHSIQVSPNGEDVDRHNHSKEIVIDEKEKRVWNEQDSVWEVRTEVIKERISAEVMEIEQFKEASASARYIVFKSGNKNVIHDNTIHARADFNHEYVVVHGDERALNHDEWEGSPRPYPSDYEMVARVQDALVSDILRVVRKYDWWARN